MITPLLALAASSLLLTPAAQAGCGCTKPPPPPAAVRPGVAFQGVPLTFFGSALRSGVAYSVTFTSGTTGQTVTTSALGVPQRDLMDGATKPVVTMPTPPLPLGPTSIAVREVATGALVLAVADDAFTVAPAPVAIPNEYGTFTWPGYRAAVSRGGTVYMTLDVSGIHGPMVFDAQPLGLPLRYAANDVVFYNTQGILMQRLLGSGVDPIPGMSVSPAASPAVNGDRLRYSRHEFATYFLQHQERAPHWVDPANPNWHYDGSRHIDHDVLVVAIMGTMNGGTTPAPGATAAFDLRIGTASLFSEGLVGIDSVGASRSVLIDRFTRRTTTPPSSSSATTSGWDLYDPSATASTQITYGSGASIFTNGTLSLGSGTVVRGDVRAASVQAARNVSVTGQQSIVSTPAAFLEPDLPTGLIDLGDVAISMGQSMTIGAGSYRLGSLTVGRNANLFIDNASGPVTLYVTGTVVVSKDGTIASAAANPERFALYATGSDLVSLGIDTSFYGVVYAPKAPLQISGSGEFFGAFVARRIDIGSNAKVHYDAALRGE